MGWELLDASSLQLSAAVLLITAVLASPFLVAAQLLAQTIPSRIVQGACTGFLCVSPLVSLSLVLIGADLWFGSQVDASGYLPELR